MTPDNAYDDVDQIKQQAFDWLIRLQEGPETAELQAQFAIWLSQSPKHAQVWDKACLMWASIGEASSLSDSHPVVSHRPRRSIRRRWRAAGLAAGAAVFALCLCYFALPALLLQYEAEYQTATAEIRTIHLQDGSELVLGAASAVATDFSMEKREVRLLAGEAYFDVARDTSRPFHVVSRDLDVKVLGTAFNVRVSQEGTEIGLERGSVQASGSIAGLIINEKLSPGDLVILDRERGTATRETLPVSDMGAWRTGRLIVVDATIGSVIDQIRRYHPSWIAVPDAKLASRRVTGIFNLAEPDRALIALVAPHGGQVRKVSSFARIVTGF